MTKLTLTKLRNAATPGMYSDGQHGLYLRVTPGGSKSWVQRFTYRGKRSALGLGAWPVVSLDEARNAAIDNLRLIRRGLSPIAEKRKAKQAIEAPTFREAAALTIETEAHAWKGGEHGITADHWRRSFTRHAFPAFGDLLINEIRREDVLAVLTPIWTETPEAARKLRRRCAAVFNWAIAQRHRANNPAGEVISPLLPKLPQVSAHLRALPYQDIAGALRIIEASPSGIAAKACLHLIALTAVRSQEARLATWAEVDFEARTWMIPGGHTKTGRAHRVPLSVAALDVLKSVRMLEDGSGLIFPSPRKQGAPLSNMTLTKVLRDNGLAGRATVHGFRSSFRDWCAESGKAREVAEAALAHVVGGVEGAYFRSDLYQRRRALMDAWAQFLGGESAQVVELRRA